MGANDVSQRRYTEKEVREILSRVAKLHGERASGDADHGSTLQQLEQAAAELGLDSSLVRQAALDIDTDTGAGSSSLLLGGPWNVDSDRIVPGRVTVENWSGIVEDIRSATGRIGFPKVSGTLFEWTSEQPDGLHVSISPSGENSRVRVSARFGTLPLTAHFAGAGAGALLGVMLILSFGKSAEWAPWMLAAIPLLSSAVAFMTARLGFIPFAKRRNRQTRRFVSFLEQRIGVSEAEAPEFTAQLLSSTDDLVERNRLTTLG